VAAAADRGAVDALLDKVAGLRRRQLVAPAGAPPAELARYGLARPRARVSLALQDGKTETLALGDENPFDGSIFVQPTGGSVEVVGGDVRWPVEKDLFDLRDKRILTFEDRDVTRLEVAAPGLSYALERAGDGWRLTAPLADRADGLTAARVLGALRGLRATGFVASTTPAVTRALDHPRLRVRLATQGAPERTLALGAPPVRKGEPEPATLYARIGASGEIATVRADQVKDLAPGLWALRDKSVLAPFDREKAEAIRVESAGGVVELRRKPRAGGGPEEWSLTAPRAAPAQAAKVSGILYALSSLQATAVADESGRSLAAHGLDRPSRAVTVLDGAGAALARLEVGKEDGPKTFVRGQAPRILEVETSRLAELPGSAEELEEKAASR
jgi:hypothetical protein